MGIEMDLINIAELTSGYRERMRRIALLDSLVSLQNKQTKDAQGNSIDMRGLGMLTLLFFFERQLSREYKTGVADLQQFLLNITRDTYQIEPLEMEKIAREIMTNFRPTSGKKRSLNFFNWETKQEEMIEYSLLKVNGFDAKTQTQYYTLDEDGLELLFATKEFYSEFQISINQLLLKQQIKKGEFNSALRQIREMELDVQTLEERMEKMKLDILRSIVSEETYHRYEKLVQDTHLRFEREDEEFTALTKFVQETRDTIYADTMHPKAQNTYQTLKRIGNELEEVHYRHARLLQLTSELSTTALATAQESLYYTGIQSFNFDHDIVTTILAKPLSPDKMKGVLHPFLRVEENPFWSPLTVFAEQNILEERKEHQDETFVTVDDTAATESYRRWLGEKYAELLEQFLTVHERDGVHTLEGWMDELKRTDSALLSERYFYSFWLTMHQYSPVINTTNEYESETTFKAVYEILGNKQLIVEELPNILQYNTTFSIQNMNIIVEEADDGLS